MEYKSDFIEREVQKITLFLRGVFSKVSSGGNLGDVLQSFDRELKGKIDFGFYEILELNEKDLKNKINGVSILVLEELLKVFYEIAKKEISFLNYNNLKKVSLILLNEIENKSLIFSFERQQIKNYFKL